MPQQILRLPDVVKKTGLSRSSIYAKINQKDFPPPIKLGARAIGWPSSNIDAWIDQQIKKAAEVQR